jgi:pantoate--beta-alanine ligase
MGFLHQGHLSLVRAARQRAQIVIVSIFLNPTQFNNPADFEKYPRNLEQDLKLLRSENVDAAFCPQVSDVYAPNAETWVSVDKLSQIHEGEFRPGHFRGVTTVVNILFNIIGPELALFGEKDFQQLGLIKKMAVDLHLPIEIVGCPTVRESDGLALSSRNARLSEKARSIAPSLYRGLNAATQLFAQGERAAVKLESVIKGQIVKSDLVKIEYVRVIDPVTFEQRSLAMVGDRIVLRLIDNVVLGAI